MKNRKLFPGLYDDAQLRTMEAAIERVVTVMTEIGATSERTVERYRSLVAGLVVEIAKGVAYDEDELTQRVLERLIKPDASSDRREPQRTVQPHGGAAKDASV